MKSVMYITAVSFGHQKTSNKEMTSRIKSGWFNASYRDRIKNSDLNKILISKKKIKNEANKFG